MRKTERVKFQTLLSSSMLRIENAPISVGGSPASVVNRRIIRDCYEAWLTLIEDLMLLAGFSPESRSARHRTFVDVLVSQDFLEIVKLLDSVYSCLISQEVNLGSFKQILGLQTVSQWGKRLLSPVLPLIYSFLFENESKTKASTLRIVGQFLRYPRKLELQDIGLEEQALIGYLQRETALQGYEYNATEECKDLILGLRNIVQEWFEDFHIENLLPSHGPGSVADGCKTTADKYRALKCDPMLRVLLDACNHQHVTYYPSQPTYDLVRCSRTIFVPKTASKLRTISMEPATLQYFQQGVMLELYRYIDKHPYLGVHIRLDDQKQNQIWAMYGSLNDDYATLDLSAASDSVSWELVREVFRSVPKLFKWLLATRSKCTLLPDGTVLPLSKFAPMGSALCFPIQCILFSAVVEYASRKSRPSRTGFKPFWTVYGDDIIVHTEIADDVIRHLESLAFTVNIEKSYCKGPYRESCGVEYYLGHDVTPLYYRIPAMSKKVTPAVYESWCSTINNCAHRLPLLRLHFVKKCLASGLRPYFCYDNRSAPKLYSDQPTNFHVKSRWSHRYQRYEGRFTLVSSKPREAGFVDDTLRYFHTLVEMSRRSTRPRVDDVPLPYTVHGSVVFFSTTARPIVPFLSKQDKREAIGLDATA